MNHVNMRLRMAKVPDTHGLPDQLVSSLVWNGQQGVQIFFAVSGFLIASTALRRWGPAGNIKEFYRFRFARIAPLLLLLLAILSALDLAQVKSFTINPKVATLPRALLAALTFRVNVLEAWHGYLPANWDILWSLSVEEVFYLVFPLVQRYRTIFIALLFVCVALGPFSRTHGNAVWREYSYLGGMDAIALGVYLSHMFVVFAFFQIFLNTGKRMNAVPVFFIATILVAGVLGEIVARIYSEPLNARLRGN